MKKLAAVDFRCQLLCTPIMLKQSSLMPSSVTAETISSAQHLLLPWSTADRDGSFHLQSQA